MITQAYSDFFKELAANNNKEWFHANKKRYETDVKGPFIKLVEELTPGLLKLDSNISTVAKDALFRINRDVRFSKDKTPYHTLMKASLAPGGKKSALPGFYLGMSQDEIFVGGGVFKLQPDVLHKLRHLIKDNGETFSKIVESKSFVEHFGPLQGDKAKRYDKELMEAAKTNPYISHKSMYAMKTVSLSDHLNSEELPETIMAYFKKINPLLTFIKKAF